MPIIPATSSSRKARSRGWIYVAQHPLKPDRVKIGWTAKEIEATGHSPRMAMLNFGLEAFGFGKFDIKFAQFYENAFAIEQAVHVHFKGKRCANSGSAKQVFHVTPEDAIAAIKTKVASGAYSRVAEADGS